MITPQASEASIVIALRVASIVMVITITIKKASIVLIVRRQKLYGG